MESSLSIDKVSYYIFLQFLRLVTAFSVGISFYCTVDDLFSFEVNLQIGTAEVFVNIFLVLS